MPVPWGCFEDQIKKCILKWWYLITLRYFIDDNSVIAVSVKIGRLEWFKETWQRYMKQLETSLNKSFACFWFWFLWARSYMIHCAWRLGLPEGNSPWGRSNQEGFIEEHGLVGWRGPWWPRSGPSSHLTKCSTSSSLLCALPQTFFILLFVTHEEAESPAWGACFSLRQNRRHHKGRLGEGAAGRAGRTRLSGRPCSWPCSWPSRKHRPYLSFHLLKSPEGKDGDSHLTEKRMPEKVKCLA